MVSLFGRDYTPDELRRVSGNMLQFGGVTPLELGEGRATGMRALLFRTGRLTFLVMADRALDIAWCEIEGRPLAWMSGIGLTGPQYYEPEGLGWLRSFGGGLLATCGLMNAGPPSDDEGVHHGLHGRIGHAPAENFGYGAGWQDGEYVLWAQGRMREAVVFGEQLTLSRRIEARLGSATIQITDVITNEGWTDTPFMLLYHVNPGYPVLAESSRLHLRSRMTPRDEEAGRAMALWNRGDPPSEGFQEQVFFHEAEAGADGWATAALVNPELEGGAGLGLGVRFRTAELPYMWQWRMLGEGTYVTGLEPANCGQNGRGVERPKGALRTLRSGERLEHRVDILAARGAEDIGRLVALAEGRSE